MQIIFKQDFNHTNTMNLADKDILVVLDYYNLKYKRENDSRYTMNCCFHNENTASLTINPKKGLFHCFGCQSKGNMINFVTLKENCTNKEAVRILANIFGENPYKKEEYVPLVRQPESPKENQDFHYLYQDILDFCSQKENKNIAAGQYLLNERMLQATYLSKANIKTCLGMQLESYLRSKYDLATLQNSGLVSQKNWFYFKDYEVIIPYYVNSKIDTLQFRTLHPNEFNPKYKFLAGRTCKTYNLDNLIFLQDCSIAIVEGAFDCLAMYQINEIFKSKKYDSYSAVIALVSASNIDKAIFSQFKAQNLKVDVYLDNDEKEGKKQEFEASNKAREKIESYCKEIGLTNYQFFQIHPHKDVNEWYKYLVQNP